MTLTDVLKDFAYLSVLLLIGFALRKRITLFQRYFIPTSLIAGIFNFEAFDYFQANEGAQEVPSVNFD